MRQARKPGEEPAERRPSASDEREALRRSLYSSHPDPSALATLHAASEPEPPEERIVPTAPASRRAAWMRGGGVAVVLLAVLGGAAVLLRATAPPPALPTTLHAPALAGEVIAAWSSVRSARAAPPDPAYQPSGYAVVRPAGRSVRVAVRCAGTGTVTVEASRRFVFHCTGATTTATQEDRGPLHDAFIVTARSSGDIIWAGTVVARPAP